VRRLHGWSGALLLAATVGLAACGGDDGGPSDPDPDPDPGSIRATVTGDGDALPGVTVELYADGGATPIATSTSAANGQVLFQNLDPDDYDVAVVVLAGFQLAAGQTARRDVTVLSDEMATVTFGLQEITVPPTEGQIRARVLDGTDPVPNVNVSLFASGGVTPLATLSTGTDGRVLFTDLAPAVYEVEIDLPLDYAVAPGDSVRKPRNVTAGLITDVVFGIEAPLPTLVEVVASGTSFGPEDVTIATGGKVRWVWQSNPHTVTPTGHTEWTEAMLDGPGDVFEHTFNTPGTFNYRCTIHAGMTGVVHVENP
jgi:plastocyanin